MKLFKVFGCENGDDIDYLTVGEDIDTEETIEKRELEKGDWNCLYFLAVREITEVDGCKILILTSNENPKDCSNCANQTDPDEVDNGCYMCCKGLENNFVAIDEAVEYFKE